MSKLTLLPCLDGEDMAGARRRELDMPADLAASLGRSAVEASVDGRYLGEGGQEVLWHDAVQAACAAKLSIPPEALRRSPELTHRCS